MADSMMTRRAFMATSAVAAATASLTRASDAPKAGANARIVMGVIGTGGQGRAHLTDLVKMQDVSIAAVCDVDGSRRDAAAKTVLDAREAGGPPVQAFSLYRKLLDMKEIDAVLIATPDHWHALVAIEALQAGKHVYFEKPAAHNIREGRAIASAAAKAKRVTLMGTQQRSSRHWMDAVARVKAGELGKIESVHAWNAWNRGEMFADLGRPADADAPPGVDYDMWLGPAPLRRFNPARFHGGFYFFWDYSGGMISGWGVHLFDVALWAMGTEILSACTAGGKFVFDDIRETPDTATAVFECPGFELTYSMRHGNSWRAHGDMDHGIEFFGTKGTLQINRNGFQVYREQDRSSRKPHFEQAASDNAMVVHKRHFFDCIRDVAESRCDAQTGHLSSIPGHLANISYRVGRKIRWNGKEETIENDPEASKLLTREYRSPWRL